MAQHSTLSDFGIDGLTRLKNAIQQLQKGGGIVLLDDEDRENEGDLIFAAQSITTEQMAFMIHYCSGIVCLCLEEQHSQALGLTPMTINNLSPNQTAFTISIEAAENTTTGVSAQDRVTTIQAAIQTPVNPQAIISPGHVFPLVARPKGLRERRGHTEGTIDLMHAAKLKPTGVLCELMNRDGTMARLPHITQFAKQYHLPILTIEDIVQNMDNLSC
ncbi:MAG: 3,4-dihydroxy-2-butanone-4-phosphate synthase [Endozoicomonadaceae bacterium]|nr:3,4-dihydroxy-2-butanone-4-phosphate synthase [Endozoicomonadaceae bacterium]